MNRTSVSLITLLLGVGLVAGGCASQRAQREAQQELAEARQTGDEQQINQAATEGLRNFVRSIGIREFIDADSIEVSEGRIVARATPAFGTLDEAEQHRCINVFAETMQKLQLANRYMQLLDPEGEPIAEKNPHQQQPAIKINDSPSGE